MRVWRCVRTRVCEGDVVRMSECGGRWSGMVGQCKGHVQTGDSPGENEWSIILSTK